MRRPTWIFVEGPDQLTSWERLFSEIAPTRFGDVLLISQKQFNRFQAVTFPRGSSGLIWFISSHGESGGGYIDGYRDRLEILSQVKSLSGELQSFVHLSICESLSGIRSSPLKELMYFPQIIGLSGYTKTVNIELALKVDMALAESLVAWQAVSRFSILLSKEKIGAKGLNILGSGGFNLHLN